MVCPSLYPLLFILFTLFPPSSINLSFTLISPSSINPLPRSFVRSLSSFLCLSVLPAPPSLCLFCGFDFLSALLSSFLPLELLYPNLSGPHSLSLLLARSLARSLGPSLPLIITLSRSLSVQVNVPQRSLV
jgi:hypothetical protein